MVPSHREFASLHGRKWRNNHLPDTKEVTIRGIQRSTALSEAITRVVVVGGGTGGTLAANLLAKSLRREVRSGHVSISLVSGSDTHAFQPGYLHIAFSDTRPEDIIREERTLLRREISLIQQDARRIDLKTKEVVLVSGQTVPYDFIIIATGSVADLDAIPGLRETSLTFHTSAEESLRIRDALDEFEGGHIVIGIAGVPHKCPPSPNEAAFLLDDYLRMKRIRDKVKITFITPYPRVYPSEPMSRIIQPLFERRDIKFLTFFNVDRVDQTEREVRSLEGNSVKFDMLILVPPHRGADVIVKSGIGDADGWIPTDRYSMRIVEYADAYAIGDATDIPIAKTGVAAHLEARVAVNNIVNTVRGERNTYTYSGRTNCPFEVGSGRATFVVGSYNVPVKQMYPTRVRYAMKKVFSRMYWQTLSGGWDWLFGMYFGKTCLKNET